MGPVTYYIFQVVCCILMITQSCVHGKPRKPILEIYSEDPNDVDMIGSMVSLHCTNSLNAQKFYLKKGGNTGVIQEQSSPEFIIMNLSKSDSGLYTCQYSTKSELSELSDSVYLFVSDRYPPPTITAEPHSIVNPGEDVTIICNSSYPNSIFTLLKGNTQIMESNNNPFIYVIQNANEEHVGQYSCRYKKLDIQSDFSSPLMIDVKALPSPFITWEYDEEGKPKILCTAPEYNKRMWFQLFNESKDVIDEIKAVKENQVDFIVPFPEQSQSRYYCLYRIRVRSNFADSLLSDAAVIGEDRYPPPTITANPHSIVQQGENVTIVCNSSYPNSIFTIFKGNTQIKENDNNPFIYVIHNANKEHAGQYSCRYRKFNIESDFSSPLMIDVKASKTQDYTTGNIFRLLLSTLIIILLTVIVVNHFKSNQESKSRPPELPAPRKKLAIDSEYTKMEDMVINNDDSPNKSSVQTPSTTEVSAVVTKMEVNEMKNDEKSSDPAPSTIEVTAGIEKMENMGMKNGDSLEKSSVSTPATVYAMIAKTNDQEEQQTKL